MAALVRHSWCVALVSSLFVLAGCNPPDDSIKTYKVANPEQPKRNPGDDPKGPGPGPVDAGPAKVRFLGAVIPAGGADGFSYFVRFLGPVEQIDAHEKDFDAFLNSIRVPGEGGKPISWKIPDGWKEGAAKPVRVVTIQKAGAPDLYVSDPLGGDLLQNVNRWRTDFVGIPAVRDAKEAVTEFQLGGTKAYRVDLRGPGGKGGMGGPFMGGK